METKSLLYGLIGFFAGGLLVSVAANMSGPSHVQRAANEMSMTQMTTSLKDVKGDPYDERFLAHMIAHHQAAVDMARLSAERADHQEIKDLSRGVIAAQEQEIRQMEQWQRDWGYRSTTGSTSHSMH